MTKKLAELLHTAGQISDAVYFSAVPENPERSGAPTVTPRQVAVLAAVAAHEGCNQTQLVEYTGIDRSTLADIVRRLVERKLLKRERTRKDARMYSVRLTESSKQALKTGTLGVNAVEGDVEAKLGAKKAAQLTALLAEYVKKSLEANEA